MGKVVLGYWDIRGLAEPARLLLEYGGVDWEDKRYTCGGAPDYDKSVWRNVKHTFGLDFPNLPYLIDGDVKLTESWAIYRYLAKKVGIFPKTEKQLHESDMLQGVIQAIQGGMTSTFYNPDFEKMKPQVRENQSTKLAQCEKFLQGRNYLTGPNVTFVDFPFFETVDHHRMAFPDILDEFPNIKGFMERFEGQERIAAYRKSGRFHKFPVNNPMATWGGGKE